MQQSLQHARLLFSECWNCPDTVWTIAIRENPPVGLILCSQKDEAVARYALEGLPNKILATEYRTVLPDEELIAEEIEKTRRELEARRAATPRLVQS